jgi:uncharacterized phage infection (PIP) family protein YhgE
MIDKASIVAAKEMVDYPNTKWDRPDRRDEVLAVARTCIKTAEMVKAEKKKAKALRAKLKEAKRLLKKASDWLETANGIIQDGPDREEGDDEDARAFIEDLREAAA